MTSPTDTILTVISPPSLSSWYGRFCGDMQRVMFIGEAPEDVRGLLTRIVERAVSRHIRLFSGHDSMLRDWALAQELRLRGFIVESQSGMSCGAGSDKLLQKRILSLAHVPTPAWGTEESDPPADVRALWKGRSSTQSRDITWHTKGGVRPTNSYWEEFVDGEEYSVVLHREAGETACLPVVWKGAVRQDLSPPWRRLRLVPSGAPAGLVSRLTAISQRVADVVDLCGFAEVEFIVRPDGHALVTEINPRISGTARIAAMAADVLIFDRRDTWVDRASEAVRFAAEVPYSGDPFMTDSLIATSRLTCVGSSPGEVLEQLLGHGYSHDGPVPRVWRED